VGLLRREEALGLVMGRKKISTPALPFSSVLFEPAQQFGPATATEEVQTETVRQSMLQLHATERFETTGGFLIWVCRGWRKAGKINLHCAVLF